ncbi:MAG TPA: hypothetical protein VKP30_32950 [Polyangiaceae bacterium]|nr:hypothetical protein [Polyangiaceae bacterium]
MSANKLSVLAAILSASSILCACQSGDEGELVGLSVSGLTESKTFAACTEQVLTATHDPSVDANSVYQWNINAPSEAQYSPVPDGHQLRFVARTPGVYSISVSECPASDAAADDCSVTEFNVTVVTGADANANGIGDACEAADCIPACEGRSCGVDPICGQSCGTCTEGQSCNLDSFQCEAACVPACEGRVCGLDPVCGTSCGSCGNGQTCNEAAGQCNNACVPSCGQRVCGLDPACGTSCGSCDEGSTCNAAGACVPAELPGKVVTIVMSLTNKRLANTDPRFRQRARLIESSVQWVSPTESPNVLVVLDDACTDCSKEAKLIQSTLTKRGTAATFINEPAQGLKAEDVAAFDVVWFANPTQAVDDAKTIQTLTEFAQNGGGVIVQGDDITQPEAMQALTQLRHVNTGNHYCGRYISGNRGASYKVKIASTSHPVTSSILGNSYYYGNDIDNSVLIADANATVLAWAQVGGCRRSAAGATNCDKQPVIVAYDMNQ